MIDNHTRNGNVTYKGNKSQEEIVLDYLKEHGSIDEPQAKKLGVVSLANVVARMDVELKSDHYQRKLSTFSPNKKRVLRYRL